MHHARRVLPASVLLVSATLVCTVCPINPASAGRLLPWRPMPLVERTAPPEEDTATPPGNVVSYDPGTGETVYRLASPVLYEEGASGFVPGSRGEAPEYVPFGHEGLEPKNFGPYTTTPDPATFPYSTHVRLSMWFIDAQGDTARYICSGTLIDPMHVVTAGHCVYSHENGEGWAYRVEVEPSYTNGVKPFGSGFAREYHSWSGWVQSRDTDHDLALIDMDRPVGYLTGWRGYGWSNNCDFFTGGSWAHHAYPADDGFDGQTMQTNVGDFDGCDDVWGSWYGNEVWADRPGIHGTSGGGAIRNDAVWAVRSNTTPDAFGDKDAFDCRITSGKFADIESYIDADVGNFWQLIPLDVRSPDVNIPAGGYLQVFDVGVANYADGTFASTLQMNAYLSPDPYITPSDVLLGSFAGYREIGPRGFVRVSLPGWQIPPGTPSGQYFLGVIITVADENETDNATLPVDTDTLWVGCPAPGTATTVSPANGSTCVPTATTLTWAGLPDAAGYQVQVDPMCAQGPIYNTPVSYLDVGGLTPGTYYRWRVRAESACNPGTYGPWGYCSVFRTMDATPGTVTLTSPASGTTCTPIGVVLDWEWAPSSDLYHVQVGTACGSGTIHIADSGSDLTVTGLLYNTTYFWRVRGRSGCGTNGPWSACRSFTTAPSPLAAPAVISPLNGDECVPSNHGLSWNPVAGAASYLLRYGPSGCFANADTTLVVNGTSAPFPEAIPGATYLWSVSAMDQCGAAGVSSACNGFTLRNDPLDAAVDSMEPGNDIGCAPSTVRLTWDAVPGATDYQIEFGAACPGGVIYSTTQLWYEIPGVPAGDYTWRMRATDACSIKGYWSPCFPFTVDTTAPGSVGNLSSSTHAIRTWSKLNQIAFAWTAPRDPFRTECGSMRYSIQLDKTATSVPDAVADLTSGTYITAPLADGVGRWFHVRAVDEAGNASSSTSHLGPFQIDTVPPQVTVLYPNGGEVWEVGTERTIRWTASDDRSGLRTVQVFYSTDGGETLLPIASVPPGVDGYTWLVPDAQSQAAVVAVAVTDSAGSTTQDLSDDRFSILASSGVGDSRGALPTALLPNVPNPFRASTTVAFTLAESGSVRLTIVDVGSRVVRRLLDGAAAAGEHRLTWDGRDDMGRSLSAGLYFLHLEAGGRKQVRRMLLLH